MKPISPEIHSPFDAALVKKGIPVRDHFHYRKWLRYYLDFCAKYHHSHVDPESFGAFAQKIKEKRQTEKQCQQAFDAVSIYYDLEKIGEFSSSLNKKVRLSQIKTIGFNHPPRTGGTYIPAWSRKSNYDIIPLKP